MLLKYQKLHNITNVLILLFFFSLTPSEYSRSSACERAMPIVCYVFIYICTYVSQAYKYKICLNAFITLRLLPPQPFHFPWPQSATPNTLYTCIGRRCFYRDIAKIVKNLKGGNFFSIRNSALSRASTRSLRNSINYLI